MISRLKILFAGLDKVLIFTTIAISLLGLFTLYSYSGNNYFFNRQIVWLLVSIAFMFIAAVPDYRFLRFGNSAIFLYLITFLLLVAVMFLGEVTLGARSRFDLGLFFIQPSDPAKLVLIILLSKYFAKRHEMIGDFSHIIISGIYAALFFVPVLLQPDFGSAAILFSIWFGLVFVSGINIKHILWVFTFIVVAAFILWNFVFIDYQKDRIKTFLNPLSDIQGAGYNAYQSTVAVGSGQLFGKGIGFGTQSKLLFLPEYETDFIFAAFAEEWGLFGVVLLFLLFFILFFRILKIATESLTNFERLFAAGVCIFFIAHFFIHVGINIGLLPVTGTTIPFLSYGGSHLLTEFIAIGMIMGMRNQGGLKLKSKDLFD